MNSKWYLSTLIVILAILGVSLEQDSTPNQEILMQFSDEEINRDQAQNALAMVKKQLEFIGVENIQVIEGATGNLKITYYSEVDVAVIKSILSKESSLELGYTSYQHNSESEPLPFSNKTNGYQLNVSEIQHNPEGDLAGNGFLYEFKSINDRFFDPVVYIAISPDQCFQHNQLEKVTYTVQHRNALHIDNTSYCIPEVRAGPFV